ncbi:MAG TPA: hypothetical protein VFX59_23020 [Polyangiales bacterium]|nr:hypothetical protein [Polyangiales bacterium]
MTSWFDERLRARAGALVPVAEKFLDGRELARGPDGLIALCAHMEDWLERDDVDEEGERRFVEQAGAMLGMLLIDHVGDAGHVARNGTHRVRLGRYGFFDPFSAVDRALDASDVRRALARQIVVAEAESQARGPLSRLVGALMTALQEQRPDLHLVEQFEHTLWLRADGEPFELDLKRAVESTRDQGLDAVHAVVAKLLAMLPGATASEGLALDQLVPRIARLDALLPGLFARPLSEELVVALMVEERGRARYLRTNEVDEHPEAYELALRNLRQHSEQARIATIETEHGPLWIARTGDGRDSARVLLASLHEELRARIGPRVLLGIPHRDTFYACDARNGPLAHELATRTAHDFERAPHQLSARAFTL